MASLFGIRNTGDSRRRIPRLVSRLTNEQNEFLIVTWSRQLAVDVYGKVMSSAVVAVPIIPDVV